MKEKMMFVNEKILLGSWRGDFGSACCPDYRRDLYHNTAHRTGRYRI